MRLDAAQVEFFRRLGKTPDGQQLASLIQAEIAECNTQLRKLSGEALLREQGKATYLDELERRLSAPESAQVVPRRPTQTPIGRL